MVEKMTPLSFHTATLEALRELRDEARKNFNACCDCRDWGSANIYGDEVQRYATAINRAKHEMRKEKEDDR